jgi:hypothetical protein
MYACMCRLHVCIRVPMFTHTHIYRHRRRPRLPLLGVPKYMHTYMCMYMYIYLYIYTYTHRGTYIYIHKHTHTGIDGDHGCRCSAYPHLAGASNPIKDSQITVPADVFMSGHHGHTETGPGNHEHKKRKTRGSQFCVVLCICMEDFEEVIQPSSTALRLMAMQVSGCCCVYVCVCLCLYIYIYIYIYTDK